MHRRAFLVDLIGCGVLGVLIAIPAMGAKPVPASSGGYRNITASTLKQMLDAKDFFFVNVHVPYQGEISQTDAFIPFGMVEKHFTRFPQKKDAKIVLYCMSDHMSTIAAEKLVQLGYTNVWNLKGGMGAWRTDGYALVEKRRGEKD